MTQNKTQNQKHKKIATPEPTGIKHYPKPKYSFCNKGHPLVEIYDERYNVYRWDCPKCMEDFDDDYGQTEPHGYADMQGQDAQDDLWEQNVLWKED